MLNWLKNGFSVSVSNQDNQSGHAIMNNATDRKQVTATVGTSSIVTNLEVRSHQFCCDETEKYGGEDQHPDPFDYILAGLASCVAITLRQYADKHNLPLNAAEVRCTYEKHNDPATSRKDKITKAVKLSGKLSDKDKARLMRAANCPAHQMLERGIVIDTIAA